MKKLIDYLCKPVMTFIGGFFLILSIVLSAGDINILLDPAWITVIISGTPLVYSAVKRLIHNKGISKISSALLISVAMIAAILIDDLFAAGEVAFIMAIGEMLEDKTTDRARRGLKKLIDLSPKQGRLVLDGNEKMIPVEEINAGDIIRILPGEAIPVDGEVIAGETSVDQAVITGESLPVDKLPGDSVFCGTINRFGVVDICTTKTGVDSSLSKLIRMVQEAEDKKAPMQRIADRWASWLVPLAMLIAIVAYFVTKDITRAVTVLVVFCPCALVLATPTAIMAAIGQATKHGVVIKSGEALEKMGKAQIVAFDKTGTITQGKLVVSDILTFSDKLNEKEIIKLAASAELRSEHPLGKAIVAYARKENIDLSEPQDFRMIAGKGVFANVLNQEVICGNDKILRENNITMPEVAEESLGIMQNQGKASIIVCKNGECVGIVGLSDELREESKTVISSLKRMGVRSVLLTGDNRYAAGFFAGKTGIDEVYSELLPEQKVDIISKIQKEKETVCMIGDGVNDAPALKLTDVGVAMGGEGCDIAVEAADIALMSDDISKIPYLKRLSNETVKTIKFSIALSLGINFAAIFLSFAGLLTPTTGALVHNAGSLFVIFIAALLYDRKFEY